MDREQWAEDEEAIERQIRLLNLETRLLKVTICICVFVACWLTRMLFD